MIFVDRNSIPIPEIFFSEKISIAKKRVEEFYSRSENSRSQERFKPFAFELVNEIKSSARQLFKDKCAYCESLIPLDTTSGDVDNFRPKNGARGFKREFSKDHYWWLMYEWNNQYYCCANCNKFKATWFPVEGKRVKVLTPYLELITKEKALLIDPCIDKPEEHLIFKENGDVDFLSPKGKTTIEILKLNRSDLILSRQNALKVIIGIWKTFFRLWNEKEKNKGSILKAAFDLSLIVNGSYPAPYLGAQRQIILKLINNDTDILNFLNEKQYERSLAKGSRSVQEAFSSKSTHDTSTFTKQELESSRRREIEKLFDFSSLKHIYLDRIELKNFKCFSYLEIKFNDQISTKVNDQNNLQSEPWLLFLGENSVGKTSILKAIALALMGDKYRSRFKIKELNILKNGTKEGFIKLYLKGQKKPIHLEFKKNGLPIKSNFSVSSSCLLAYGAIRLLPISNKLEPEKISGGGIKVQNLFDHSISLEDGQKWLLKLSKKEFDKAAITLKDLMLLENEDRIIQKKKEKKIRVSAHGLVQDIENLSDGYKSVFALAVDIMCTLITEKVSYDLAEGIVLIDEIGTHLHPRWKMEVVKRFRTAFPKLQFIVTTHEPLCLRGLYMGEVTVLTRNSEKKIVAITELPDPSKLRVDQILTSEFFGLNTTIDPKTEELFNKYYSLLALEKPNEKEQVEILQLNQLIPKITHLGDSLREEIAYYVIDELLAKNIRNGQQKNREELKKEALETVKKIWDNLSEDKIF
jgi:predicted ATPase